ncbi:hypothetical protein [Rhizobium etli]|nr:hypothetical protein [Rhizobium sp. IE4771]
MPPRLVVVWPTMMHCFASWYLTRRTGYMAFRITAEAARLVGAKYATE